MEWNLKWFKSHRPLAILLILVTITSIFGIYVVFGTGWYGQLLVCPGCNPPEMLQLDHYTVQNNTSNKPSILTMWLFGQGPAGKSLQVQELYLENGPMKYPGCQWIPYNESSCLTPFTVQPVTVPSRSIVPVSIDTSSQGIYFTADQQYRFDIVTTDKAWFGGWIVTYPPPGLIMTGYTMGTDNGQSQATRLTLTLANMATTPVTLVSLTLKDVTPYLNSTSYSFPMSNPRINQPLASAQATLDTLSSGFYFEHQHSYSLTIISSNGPNSTAYLNY